MGYNPVQTFTQEADELLAAIEQSALSLGEGEGSEETIHQLFRAFHTIKGSGAMCGLDAVAGFTADNPNEPMWDSGVRHALKKAASAEGCGFPGFGPHSLRRANITWRQEVGGSRIEARYPSCSHPRPGNVARLRRRGRPPMA